MSSQQRTKLGVGYARIIPISLRPRQDRLKATHARPNPKLRHHNPEKNLTQDRNNRPVAAGPDGRGTHAVSGESFGGWGRQAEAHAQCRNRIGLAGGDWESAQG